MILHNCSESTFSNLNASFSLDNTISNENSGSDGDSTSFKFAHVYLSDSEVSFTSLDIAQEMEDDGWLTNPYLSYWLVDSHVTFSDSHQVRTLLGKFFFSIFFLPLSYVLLLFSKVVLPSVAVLDNSVLQVSSGNISVEFLLMSGTQPRVQVNGKIAPIIIIDFSI